MEEAWLRQNTLGVLLYSLRSAVTEGRGTVFGTLDFYYSGRQPWPGLLLASREKSLQKQRDQPPLSEAKNHLSKFHFRF